MTKQEYEKRFANFIGGYEKKVIKAIDKKTKKDKDKK